MSARTTDAGSSPRFGVRWLSMLQDHFCFFFFRARGLESSARSLVLLLLLLLLLLSLEEEEESRPSSFRAFLFLYFKRIIGTAAGMALSSCRCCKASCCCMAAANAVGAVVLPYGDIGDLGFVCIVFVATAEDCCCSCCCRRKVK